jgi:hypothetical protein
MNVEHKEYASKGVAGTGLGFGIAGTALALLQNGGLGNLLGGGWGGWGNCGCGGNAALAGGMGLAALAEKDARIAQLSAELDTDRKLIQVWDNLNTKREATDMKVATLEAKCETMQYVLGNITKVVVPNTAVCPGWGAVTVAPATAAAAGAAAAR